MSLQSVRGTRDLRGGELKSLLDIVSTSRQVSALYGFEEIETPIFEFTEVFSRTLGDASDIVTKEMYTFTDKSGDSLTLRPEGTAGVARSVISESLFRELPLKYFYQGAMFRHERPQKGRYRQFYQIGAELIGVASPVADAEVISLAWTIFKKLNLQDKVQLEINSIGDAESRKKYREILKAHFSKNISALSEESRQRLDRNPLRILDSKSEQDKPFIASAPQMIDAMNDTSRVFFEQLQSLLKKLEIPFVINDKLVRGLDYYCHTVFEFTTTALGAQNAVLSGGRYDGLIETMGGPATPAVGWGGGIDRLALLADKTFPPIPAVGVVPLNPENEPEALRIMEELRRADIPAQMPYTGNLSKRLKKLERFSCAAAIIVGGDEETKNQVQLKDLSQSQQKAVAKHELIAEIKRLLGSLT